jgi:hypothetical protein
MSRENRNRTIEETDAIADGSRQFRRLSPQARSIAALAADTALRTADVGLPQRRGYAPRSRRAGLAATTAERLYRERIGLPEGSLSKEQNDELHRIRRLSGRVVRALSPYSWTRPPDSK